ncbi:MAG: sulfotransferase family 2 domain-containing protein [Chloroflexota bacterium]
MMYSKEYRLAVFMVPKVCTYSIGRALGSAGFAWYSPVKEIEDLKHTSMVARCMEDCPFVKDYRRASFVRHPETRLASGWRWLRGINHVPCVGDFPDFVEQLCGGEITDRVIYWDVGVSQTRHLYDEGRLLVDRVGKFENLQQDWLEMLRWAGVPEVPLDHVNASGPPMDYQELYNPALRERVRQHFAEDYENFDYC